MPLKSDAAPRGSRAVLHTALRRRSHAHVEALRGELQTGRAIPVYRVSFAAFRRAGCLRNSKRVSWCFPVIGGKQPALAFISSHHGRLRFGGISQGTSAASFLDATLFAQAQLASSRRLFKVRILDIPSLRLRLLWLYSPRGNSAFVPLMHEPREPTPILLRSADFEARVKAALTLVKRSRQQWRSLQRESV